MNYDDIALGSKTSRKYVITPEMHAALADAFGDRSPLHVDAVHARKLGFKDRVMHGAILNGLVSHFIGMCLPGERALLHSVKMEYKKPNYLNDELLLEATVSQKVDALRVVLLDVSFHNVTQGYKSASGVVQAGVSE